jgi:hypothetical protein
MFRIFLISKLTPDWFAGLKNSFIKELNISNPVLPFSFKFFKLSDFVKSSINNSSFCKSDNLFPFISVKSL